MSAFYVPKAFASILYHVGFVDEGELLNDKLSNCKH